MVQGVKFVKEGEMDSPPWHQEWWKYPTIEPKLSPPQMISLFRSNSLSVGNVVVMLGAHFINASHSKHFPVQNLPLQPDTSHRPYHGQREPRVDPTVMILNDKMTLCNLATQWPRACWQRIIPELSKGSRLVSDWSDVEFRKGHPGNDEFDDWRSANVLQTLHRGHDQVE